MERILITASDKQFLTDFIDWITKYPRDVEPNSVILTLIDSKQKFKKGEPVVVVVPNKELENEIQIGDNGDLPPSLQRQQYNGKFIRYRLEQEMRYWRSNDDCLVEIDGVEKCYPSSYIIPILE